MNEKPIRTGEIFRIILMWEAGQFAAALMFSVLGLFDGWILPVILCGIVSGCLLYYYRMRKGSEGPFSGLRLTQR